MEARGAAQLGCQAEVSWTLSPETCFQVLRPSSWEGADFSILARGLCSGSVTSSQRPGLCTERCPQDHRRERNQGRGTGGQCNRLEDKNLHWSLFYSFLPSTRPCLAPLAFPRYLHPSCSRFNLYSTKSTENTAPFVKREASKPCKLACLGLHPRSPVSSGQPPTCAEFPLRCLLGVPSLDGLCDQFTSPATLDPEILSCFSRRTEPIKHRKQLPPG